MRTLMRLLTALGIPMISASPAWCGETIVVEHVLGPEGPLVVNGDLYYVSWNPGSLLRWDGRTSKVINDAPDCSHNGLALTGRKTFLVACDAAIGIILELDLAGKELRRWAADNRGRRFDGGVNDIVVTANGAAYATIFGPFSKNATDIVGRILYLPPGGESWMEVANDINYANGIAVSADQKTLYVAEMVGNLLLAFSIQSDGTLSHRRNFASLSLLISNKVENWWSGPDSLKVDSKGNLYVAQFYGGRILKISPKGELLYVFDIAAGNGTTNVAFDEGEKNIYVTVVKNADDVFGRAEGSIVKLPNLP